ncbi:PREDICTED: zinc finger protein 708-like [Thamnophis sirtalis]|uniref:Zinc finger protein 708-like n=1 Tax=Thamnophis sirtalis TaxID=35019 RepID=A0A6I9YR31_9SAUR|nr:PREDICTED: zinc finger protein 708-like [Thamnophis sirtalis]
MCRGRPGGSGDAGEMSPPGPRERALPGGRCKEEETCGDPETVLEDGGRSQNPQSIQEGGKKYRCEKSFKNNGHLQSHLRIHSLGNPFKCLKCGKSFSELGTLYRHEKIHLVEKTNKCRVCEKSFKTNGNLQRHLRIHSVGNPIKCFQCGKNFSRTRDLTQHQRIHTGEKPYKCLECEKSFCHSSSLYKHKRLHLQIPYQCRECEKYFRTIQILEKHQRIHSEKKLNKCLEGGGSGRSESPQRIKEGERKYQCPECEKSFQRVWKDLQSFGKPSQTSKDLLRSKPL